MDKTNTPKDDLFKNSTMTFGEHLEELRVALMKSAIALAIGLGIGLLFANRVVQFVQVPLAGAINRFMADKTLYKMGIDPKSEKATEMKKWLIEKSLVSETIYVAETATLSPLQEASNVPEQPLNDAQTVNPAHDDSVVIDPTKDLIPVKIWRPIEAGLNSFEMTEPFMIWLKAGLVIGAILSSPFVFYFIWQFVAAGLYTHERKYVYVYAPFSVGLFWSGVLLAFFLVLKYVLDFLLTFNASLNVDLVPRLSNYVSFVLLLPLGFGIAFQLPLIMLFLQRIGLFETQAYVGSWRVAVLVIAILSMILTPADIYSMIALMVPLVFLYFLGIAMCKYMPRGRGIGSQGYDPA